jgi:hypothetical protein
MRSIPWVACVLALAMLGSSCDTTQPMFLAQQTFQLSVRTAASPVQVFNVYTGFVDNNNDGMPDGDTFLFCKNRVAQPVMSAPTSLPWGFTIEIKILKAGETEAQLIVSDDAVLNSDANLAEYDTSNYQGSVPTQAPITLGGQTFKFINGRILSSARESVMAATVNPLALLDPATYGVKGQGLCSTSYPGPSVIDRPSGAPYPYQIVLQKGDTVTVGVRRAELGPPGVPAGQNPGINSTFTLEGSSVNVRGTQSSATAEPGAGFSFSYTSR